MTDTPFISDTTVATIQRARRRLQRTWELFWADAYTIERLTRPDGWDDGEETESWSVPESGVGKLRSNGQGTEEIGEMVIVGMAPYQLDMLATTLLSPNDRITVNDRDFGVVSVTREGEGKLHATAYLRERNSDTSEVT